MTQNSIFITGAASGIGRATAKLFHSKGWYVGGYDVDTAELETLKQELGDRGITGRLDVCVKDEFDAALASFTEKTGGRLDIMFNNAGITVGGFFDDVPFEKIADMVNINLLGVLGGTYAAIPYLKQTQNSLCIATSSSAAMFGTPHMATYGATKFAIKGFTHAMSVELARYGVRAADVMPGTINTPLWQSSKYEAEKEVSNYEHVLADNSGIEGANRTTAPSEVAEAVWKAYHGTKLHWYVPEDLEQDDFVPSSVFEASRDERIQEAMTSKD